MSKGWIKKTPGFFEPRLVRDHLNNDTRSELEDLVGDFIMTSIRAILGMNNWFAHNCVYSTLANGNFILGVDEKDLLGEQDENTVNTDS